MKRTIVISAINLRSGGPLSILNDCLSYLDQSLGLEYKIIALVHKRDLLIKTNNINYIEFPKSIQSYLYRFYYEYYYFNKLSKKIKPYLWFSLHDMSPIVHSEIQAVYCHNPSPFYKVNFKEFILDRKFTFFSIFYKYIYGINIKSNTYVVVQQNWLRKKFNELYGIQGCIVAHPTIMTASSYCEKKYKLSEGKVTFFYPSFPRVFKNFELIFEAVENINPFYKDKFEVIVTIDGMENSYSKKLVEKYQKNKNINFMGLQSRGKAFELYSKSDCLIFPSKLETWGLPISEFKAFKKPILLANLEYAHETIGAYEQVKFFELDDFIQLTKYMEDFINGSLIYDGNSKQKVDEPFVQSWSELFGKLLNGCGNATS